MDAIREFVKNYVIFLLVLRLLSYLLPKESDRKYIQFFAGVLLAVLLLRPLLSVMQSKEGVMDSLDLDELKEQLWDISYEGEEEDMFDLFIVEEDTQ